MPDLASHVLELVGHVLADTTGLFGRLLAGTAHSISHVLAKVPHFLLDVLQVFPKRRKESPRCMSSGEDVVKEICESAMVGFPKIQGQERETNLKQKHSRPFEGVRGPGTCQAQL